MAYEPQTWANGRSGGTPISAARLAHIESGVAAAALKGDLVLNIRDYGAVADGVTDCYDAISEAISHAPVSGATIYFPRGENTYYISRPVALVSGLRYLGESRGASHITSDGAVFAWSSNASNVSIEHLYLRSTADHIFKPGSSGGLHLSHLSHCVFDQASASHSIWYQDNAVSFIDVLVDDCDLYRAASSTLAGWYVRNTAGALNSNRWINCRINSRNTTAAPFFYLESAASGNFAHDNRFVGITGEQNTGGLIHAYSVCGLTIEDVVDWDASVNYAADLVKVGKSATSGAPVSRGVRIRNFGRRGGTLAGGVYDINCVPGEVVLAVVENPNPSSGSPSINMTTTNSVVLGASGSALATYYGRVVVDSGDTSPAMAIGSSAAAGEALVALQPTVSSYAGDLLQCRDFGESGDRFNVRRTGGLNWGNGTAATDVSLSRGGVGILAVTGKLTATAGLGVGNSAAATTPGTVTRKIEVFDAAGNSLGFIAVYNSIT